MNHDVEVTLPPVGLPHPVRGYAESPDLQAWLTAAPAGEIGRAHV